jgi:hypothetical protein
MGLANPVRRTTHAELGHKCCKSVNCLGAAEACSDATAMRIILRKLQSTYVPHLTRVIQSVIEIQQVMGSSRQPTISARTNVQHCKFVFLCCESTRTQHKITSAGTTKARHNSKTQERRHGHRSIGGGASKSHKDTNASTTATTHNESVNPPKAETGRA